MDNYYASAASPSVNIIIQKEGLRISVLTSRMIRIERGSLTDLPTQTVWCRDLGRIPFQWKPEGAAGTLETDDVVFRLDIEKGTPLYAEFKDGKRVSDFSSGILPGTARTLDMANGRIPLEKGIISRSGCSMLDDSKSLLLDGDTVISRNKCSDIYYFAYEANHLVQLKDYFRLTGPAPLIPKFALGNWWSRYKAYTQEEYRQLMQTFIRRQIPITVATIDMDWHWVDVKDRFPESCDPGKPQTVQEIMYNTLLPGWTGYSWNKELFPDHRELLRWLHSNGFRVPLNVHPSQGIRAFEDCYDEFCCVMGKDPKKKERIPFDITDAQFRKAYFEALHRPLEKEGADFWWIDWQQGRRTAVPGLDPLWALNHYHSLDMEKQGKRPLILSRYAGLGSHRYPLGFSGDSFCTWKSLAFQPYFTAAASNAGYSWWSHDIGGHQQGVQDDELYLRWLQFGVFSPINRLHSSNSEFMGKEPWHKSWAVCAVSEDFLRLRHKLIPYLYSSNYLTHTEGIPLCMPMYYAYNCEDAYKAENQYLFGSQLLVCPITRPMNKRLNLAWADVWLPEGIWTDFFTGARYRGGCWVRMHRDLDSIPVLAKEGAIVPMYRSGLSNDLSADQPLDVHIWQGDGSFALYEDDSQTMDYASGKFAITQLRIAKKSYGFEITLTPPQESHGLLPKSRDIRLCMRDMLDFETDAGVKKMTEQGYAAVEIRLSSDEVVMHITDVRSVHTPNQEALRSALLTRWQGSNLGKSIRFRSDGAMPRVLRRALDEFNHYI